MRENDIPIMVIETTFEEREKITHKVELQGQTHYFRSKKQAETFLNDIKEFADTVNIEEI